MLAIAGAAITAGVEGFAPSATMGVRQVSVAFLGREGVACLWMASGSEI